MKDWTEESKEAFAKLIEHNKRNKIRDKKIPWKHSDPLNQWEVDGLSCMVLSSPLGGINGYVEIGEDHPFFLVHYGDCPAGCDESWCGHSPENKIEVHGGITFSQLSQNGGWIFGFDTAHYGDATVYSSGRVWDQAEVEAETENMARQLAEIGEDSNLFWIEENQS
ncbi:MAG: hypothetical protein V3T23_01665 [Nitrososphaerales archaeon]